VIAAYNKYVSNTGNYYRAGTGAGNHTQKPPPNSGGGLKNILSPLLPFDIDAGDIMLLLLLLFLYNQSKDEEFLIILIVVALSIFKGA
jgi:hypothetical protein